MARLVRASTPLLRTLFRFDGHPLRSCDQNATRTRNYGSPQTVQLSTLEMPLQDELHLFLPGFAH